MVWSIHFQFAALALTLIVLFMSSSEKHLNFTSEKVFFRLLISIILSIVLDLISVFAINYRDVLGPVWVQILCKAYLLSIVVVGYLSAQFAVAEIRYSFRRMWELIAIIPVAIELLVLLFIPIGIHVSGGKLYSYGFPVVLTYVLCALYFVVSVVAVTVLKKYISIKRRDAIYFWFCFWLVGALIQFLNNELLIASYIMSLGAVYLYCKLENPEYHLDMTTSVFNRKGFAMIMRENLDNNRHKSIVVFRIGDTGVISEIFGSRAVEDAMVLVARFADDIPDSVLFRFEDDMFVMIFDNPAQAERGMEKLLNRSMHPWELNGVTVEIPLFVSYLESTSYFNEVDDLEEILYYFADESTKRRPGSVLAINEAELANKRKIIDLQHALEWALRNDGVMVYYQPIYDIKEGRFRSLEALVRLKDEAGNILSPVSFIEFAEKNGMILKLGETIFRKVCQFIQRSKPERYGVEFIEVNLSVVQCMQEDLARTLKGIMSEYYVPPYRINFEITETAAINSQAALHRNMRDLMDYGSSFSLDDYGNGYSNLSYVVGLPVNIIKIDKALVGAYFTSEKVKIATEYTIEMIHKLGLKIVVEGIETEEHYQAFKKLGVEYIQGYYFSKPLPESEIEAFLKDWL
jgi:EAL domain-containing protein (putative c-di-GMP-specific phosphodiesterase class I)/GGDEF domain-containing protein